MRPIKLILSSAALMALSSAAFADSHSTDEISGYVLHDTYQFGAAFETVEAKSASSCSVHCDSDVRCDAWSFVPATKAGPDRCEVKFSVGKSMIYPGAVSGISSRYKVTPIDMTLAQELSGGPDALPTQPSVKSEASTMPSVANSGAVPRVYRGNELAGPANILTPPKEGEYSPLLPALRGN